MTFSAHISGMNSPETVFKTSPDLLLKGGYVVLAFPY